jgi:translation elongation factor EF-Ts
LTQAQVRVCGVRTYSSGPSLLELVKALRKETKAGIADCRDALVPFLFALLLTLQEASDNDIEKAKLWLVERAKKTASKKRDRRTQEGRIVPIYN